MKNLVIIEENKINDVLNEIQEAYLDIPFENSIFQTKNFIIKWSITPERAFRNIWLRMRNRINALKASKSSSNKSDLEIERKIRKIDRMNKDKPEDYDIDVKILQIEIDDILENKNDWKKLIKDAIHELSYLYWIFKWLPKFTREEFENAEEQYFLKSLTNQISGIVWAKESINNILKDKDEDSIKKLLSDFNLNNVNI